MSRLFITTWLIKEKGLCKCRALFLEYQCLVSGQVEGIS